MFIDCSHYRCSFYDGVSIFLTSRSGCGQTLLLAFGIIPVENTDHICWFLRLCASHGINFDCALFTDQGPLVSAAGRLTNDTPPLKLSLMYCLQHLIRNVRYKFSGELNGDGGELNDKQLQQCHNDMAESATMESFFKSFLHFIKITFKI